MTVISRAQIPDSALENLETLAVWAITALSEVHSAATIAETPGTSSLAATSSPYLLNQPSGMEWHVILRSTIKLDADWRSTGAIWRAALPIGEPGTVLPPRLLQP